MDCRLSSLDFDTAASAGWYSAIAGLPRRNGAPAMAVRAVLGSTVVVAVWGAAVPLLPADVVARPWFEHRALVITSMATVGVAAASWMRR